MQSNIIKKLTSNIIKINYIVLTNTNVSPTAVLTLICCTFLFYKI